ncbi:YdcH family protein [Brevundimonas sp. AJA228-03]|uniref:YdcH family protein n=1 Tax=Brevundimonas sp. AJA228-03 TaxID=2752515 RepID=UPI001ADF6042|nr:YdcH family protein [Brevundimonas sp. AJA228-03]QTN18467.1 YdcH family protein [Brevundimonas sp. AJA228-03]
MSIVLARRLRGLHALLEMALNDERARPRPDDRTIAGIKKKKLAIKDRLAVFGDRQMSSASH